MKELTLKIAQLRAKLTLQAAEIEITKHELNEALKEEWEPVELDLLKRLAGQRKAMSTEVLRDFDWKDASFDYRCAFVKEEGKPPTIGGYVDNDRFRGSCVVYVRKDSEIKLAALLAA